MGYRSAKNISLTAGEAAYEQCDHIKPLECGPTDAPVVQVVAIDVDGSRFGDGHTELPAGMKKPPCGGFFVPSRYPNLMGATREEWWEDCNGCARAMQHLDDVWFMCGRRPPPRLRGISRYVRSRPRADSACTSGAND